MADGDHARLQRGTPNNTIIIIIYLQSGASLVLRSCFGWMLAMFKEKLRQKKKQLSRFGILLKSQMTKITVIAREHVLFSLELFFWSLPCYSGWHFKVCLPQWITHFHANVNLTSVDKSLRSESDVLDTVRSWKILRNLELPSARAGI